MTATPARCTGGTGILFAFVVGTHVVYYQGVGPTRKPTFPAQSLEPRGLMVGPIICSKAPLKKCGLSDGRLGSAVRIVRHPSSFGSAAHSLCSFPAPDDASIGR